MALDTPQGTEHEDTLMRRLADDMAKQTSHEEPERQKAADEGRPYTPEPPKEAQEEAKPKEPGTSAEPAKHRVKIDDGELEVTLDELLSGYQRHADYTRKTMALADERKKLQEGPRSQYEQLNNHLIEQLQAFMPQKPDPLMLDATSPKYAPDQYHLARAHYEQFSDLMNARQNEKQRLENERRQEAQKGQSERLAAESQRLTGYVPEWKDAKIYSEEQPKVMTFLKNAFKLTPEEMQTVGSSAAALAISRMAMQTYQAKDQKALADAKVKDAPPVIKPGAAEETSGEPESLKRLRARAKAHPRDLRLQSELMTAEEKHYSRK